MVFALAMWGSMVEPPIVNAETFEVDIVSPPAAAPEPVDEPPALEEELVVEEPEPDPVREETEAEAVIEEEKEREEVKAEVPERTVTSTPVEKPVEKPTATETAKTEVSGEDLRVRMEGLQRDFPAYYRNIVVQMQRCFRWTGSGALEAQVQFLIHRDGTVGRDIDIVRESGNIYFDAAAMEAVECAGRGRFGPLPEDMPYDQLPVLFNFQPPR
jgi:outer membrane biosynthesis protein TonB